ncbi:hypothetical protein DMH15_14745 [Streptomyces sp. WAC 06725]|uniref:hypothetical protein n=1 Tax=Streptomyces sp. WAC 06725 TaxID=2203209 RepID=UPI000F73EFC2|nr:hypothetical protein [Streptomyces sp. WAC 06725]RSO40614.1 hypothetical protein DMH15_14745 [Streptomyces sp. WAC 06725]
MFGKRRARRRDAEQALADLLDDIWAFVEVVVRSRIRQGDIPDEWFAEVVERVYRRQVIQALPLYAKFEGFGIEELSVAILVDISRVAKDLQFESDLNRISGSWNDPELMARRQKRREAEEQAKDFVAGYASSQGATVVLLIATALAERGRPNTKNLRTAEESYEARAMRARDRRRGWPHPDQVVESLFGKVPPSGDADATG